MLQLKSPISSDILHLLQGALPTLTDAELKALEITRDDIRTACLAANHPYHRASEGVGLVCTQCKTVLVDAHKCTTLRYAANEIGISTQRLWHMVDRYAAGRPDSYPGYYHKADDTYHALCPVYLDHDDPLKPLYTVVYGART